MTDDQQTPETDDDERIDEANAGTLDKPREDDEGGDDNLDSVPDA